MIPEFVLNDNSIHQYAVLDNYDLIVVKYVREPHPDDKPAVYANKEIIEKPVFYGQWRELTQEEIDTENAEIMARNKKILRATQQDKSKEQIEAELEKAYALLNEKLRQLNMVGPTDDEEDFDYE